MRHRLRRGFIVAGQRVPANVDPRRQHQPVVTERRVAAQSYEAALGIDSLCPIVEHGSAQEKAIYMSEKRNEAAHGGRYVSGSERKNPLAGTRRKRK